MFLCFVWKIGDNSICRDAKQRESKMQFTQEQLQHIAEAIEERGDYLRDCATAERSGAYPQGLAPSREEEVFNQLAVECDDILAIILSEINPSNRGE